MMAAQIILRAIGRVLEKDLQRECEQATQGLLWHIVE